MSKKFTCFSAIICFFLIIISCGHLKEAKNSYKNHNYDRTITLCKKALETDSSNVDAMILMGKCYQQKNSLEKALQITQKAYQLSSASRKIAAQLVNIHNAIGDENLKDNKYAALNHYQTAIEIRPEDKNIQKKLASTYYAVGELKKAKHYYLKIQNQKNESSISNMIAKIDKRIEKSQTLYKKGVIQYTKSKLNNALYFFNQASKQYPGSDDIQYYLLMTRARLLYEKGSVSELWDAIELFGKASVLKNKQGEPWYWMGLAYHKKDKNEFTNAIDCLTKALKLELNADLREKCKEKLQEIKRRKKKMDEFWGRE
ncbi:MAG: hypothetical protein R6V04_12540 [bacterium]